MPLGQWISMDLARDSEPRPRCTRLSDRGSGEKSDQNTRTTSKAAFECSGTTNPAHSRPRTLEIARARMVLIVQQLSAAFGPQGLYHRRYEGMEGGMLPAVNSLAGKLLMTCKCIDNSWSFREESRGKALLKALSRIRIRIRVRRSASLAARGSLSSKLR